MPLPITAEESTTIRSGIHWQHWLTLILLGLLLSLIWYRNFESYQINDGETLIFMKMFRDPTLYPDLFLIKQMLPIYFYTFFDAPPAFISLFFDPYWGLYGYYTLINCLCVCALFHFAFTITRNITASFLAVCALTFQWQWEHAMGSSAPLGLGPFPDQIATGILLFAISFFLTQRYKTAFVLAGLTFNFHGSFSIFVLAMFGAALVLEQKWAVLCLGYLIAALAALPLVVYLLQHPLPTDASLLFQTWYQLVRLRIAGHTMPTLWGFGTYARFLPYLLLFAFSYWSASIGTKGAQETIHHRQILFLSLGILVLCVIGTVFAEWIPVESIIKLTLFRSTRFFVIFAVVLYSSIAARSVEKFNYMSFAHVLLMATLIASSHPLIYAGLAALSFSSFLKRNGTLFSLVMGAIVAGAATYAVWHYGMAAIWQRSNLVLFSAVAAILVVCQLPCVFRKWERLTKPAALLTGIATVAFLSPVYPAYSDRTYFEAVKDVQLWVRDHTPAGFPVIFPPMANWSALSERAGTFSYLDLNQIYSKALVPEVLSRSQDYVESVFLYQDGGLLQNALMEAYERWDEHKITQVAQKYRSRYAVFPSSKNLSFHKVHENDYFRIYEIP